MSLRRTEISLQLSEGNQPQEDKNYVNNRRSLEDNSVNFQLSFMVHTDIIKQSSSSS